MEKLDSVTMFAPELIAQVLPAGFLKKTFVVFAFTLSLPRPMLPSTSNLYAGAGMPIPRFPVEEKLNVSFIEDVVEKTIDAPSLVPSYSDLILAIS
ncbi:hypothetical protein D3C84_735930 [compost metagenome]